MSCSIYAAKPFSLAMLIVSGLAAAVAWFVFKAGVATTAGIFVGPPLLLALLVLFLRRPVIRVDHKGVAYHPRSLPRIGWADVAGVDRAPLVEPTVDGLIYHLEDGRRPVLVVLRNAGKYLERLPRAVQTGLMVERESADVCFRIDFTGLAPASGKVYECIRQHLAVARAGKTQKMF